MPGNLCFTPVVSYVTSVFELNISQTASLLLFGSSEFSLPESIIGKKK
jgi:hypothetical protein